MTAMQVFMVREPAAEYSALPLLVVDASLLAAIYFGEEAGPAAAERIAGHRLAAPAIIDYELANVGVNKIRRNIMNEGAVEYALSALANLRLERVTVEPVAAFALAAKSGLTAYDAAYLHAAIELRAPLVTLDEALAVQARKVLAERRPSAESGRHSP